MPSHGSITKAGKVRSQTPKIEPKPRRSPNPRERNRNNYVKRVLNAAPEQRE
ncbi:MAG: 30S ribosomal protein S30e [Nitrososphaerota archaeon]